MLSAIKRFIKSKRDAWYSMNIPGKRTFGHEDPWTILTDNLHQPIVYSGGVGKSISFELELIEKYNAWVYIYDPTDTGLKTMQHIKVNDHLVFSPVALSNQDGMIKLYFPVNEEEGSYTKQVHRMGNTKTIEFPSRRIPSLMIENNHHHIDILKLDIEGSEYEVLEDVLNSGIEVHQICVEFHHFFDEVPRKKTKTAIGKLKEAGYIMINKMNSDYLFYKE